MEHRLPNLGWQNMNEWKSLTSNIIKQLVEKLKFTIISWNFITVPLSVSVQIYEVKK